MKKISFLVLVCFSFQTAWGLPLKVSENPRVEARALAGWAGVDLQSTKRVNSSRVTTIDRISIFNRSRIALGVLIILAMPACRALSMDTNEDTLQGTWSHAHDQGGGHTSYLEWTFARGQFTVGGYPPLKQTGSYRVVKSEDKTMLLHLYNQSGDWGKEETDIKIVLSSDGKSITIDGQGPFQRSERRM
jgi:hypothetical protein